MGATGYDIFNSVWSTDPPTNKGDLRKETVVTEQGHGSTNNSSTPSSSSLQSQNPLVQNDSKNDIIEGNNNMDFKNIDSSSTCHLSSTSESLSLQSQNPFLNDSKDDITEGNNNKSFKNSDSSSTCHLSSTSEPLSPRNDPLKATDHGSKSSSQESNQVSTNNSSTPSLSLLQSQNPFLNDSKNDIIEGNNNKSFKNSNSSSTCHLSFTAEPLSPRNDPLKAADHGSRSSSQEPNQVSTNNSSTSSSLQSQNPFLNESKNDIIEGNKNKSFKNIDSSSTWHISSTSEPLSPMNDPLKAIDQGSKSSSQEPNQVSTNNSSTPSSSLPSQNSLQQNGSNNNIIEGNNKSFKNSDSSSTCHVLSTSEPSSPRNDPLKATCQGPKSSSQEPNQVSTNATNKKTNVDTSDSSDDDDNDDDNHAQPESSVAASNDEFGSMNKGLELEIQKPAVQMMERPELSIDASSSYVFPPHVFAKNTTNAQADWSLASNESLFSIHMGNMSFSHELACLSRNDFWIDTPLASPLASPSQPQPPPLPLQTPSKFNDISQRAAEIHEESAGVSEMAIETMREVIMETSQNKPNATKRGKKSKNTPAVAAATASQLSTDQDQNVASKGTDENADKTVASNGAKGKQQQQQQTSNAFYQSPKPMKASRDAEEENQKKQEAPNVVEDNSSNPRTIKNPPKAGGGGWLSCFICCCR